MSPNMKKLAKQIFKSHKRHQSKPASQTQQRSSMHDRHGKVVTTKKRPSGKSKYQNHSDASEIDSSGTHVFGDHKPYENDLVIEDSDSDSSQDENECQDTDEDKSSSNSSSSNDSDLDSDSDSDSDSGSSFLEHKRKMKGPLSLTTKKEREREERAKYFRRRNKRIKEEAKMIKPLDSKDQFMEYFYAVEEALDHLSFQNIVQEAINGKRLDKSHENLDDVDDDRDIVNLLYQTCNLKDVNVLDKSTARFALSKIATACEFIINRGKFVKELEAIRLTSSLPLLLKNLQDVHLKAQLSGLPYSEERITDVVVGHIPRGQITNDELSAHYKKRKDKSIKGLYQLLVNKADQFDVDTTDFINYTQTTPYSYNPPALPQNINAIRNAKEAVTESSQSKRARNNKNKKNKQQQ
ncbi:unnamed protein product [Ambrosiozyma monospora]|uniref:Unnamed protein product n=1 Tax=Ambrosiozyma monospora TaxID=43982 RepID=A0ACB5UDX5_AMBMO|nr:unnamed protein product [Ambrosiozyma monospora]